MKLKINIKPKISYYFSILVSLIILIYFGYKGIVAYLIHKELLKKNEYEYKGNTINSTQVFIKIKKL